MQLSEMSEHDESHMRGGMLGATAPTLMELFTNPNHVTKPSPVVNEKDIPQVDKKTNALTGYDVKPKMMELFSNTHHVSKPAPVVHEKAIPQVNHHNQLTGYAVKPKMIMLI